MDTNDNDMSRLRDTIQDCNLNILVGSGISYPFFPTLGNIEVLLTAVNERPGVSIAQRAIIRASLYQHYFDRVVMGNLELRDSCASTNPVLAQYEILLRALNSILLRRDVTLLRREANIFTTNIDIFFEKALEELQLECNDGFSGRFRPAFSLSNFKKSHFKKSLHYDNVAEIPVFNLSKLHGSLCWEIDADRIVFSHELKHISKVRSRTIDPTRLVSVDSNTTIDDLLAATASMKVHKSLDAFMEEYERLLIVVNPTKDKFKHTLMNQTYYELLRLYSNELEKENAVLFVLGFSFSDEHIREITIRAANSNPTLIIYVVAHTTDAREEIESKLKMSSIRNGNVRLISPEREKSAAGDRDKFQYSLTNINEKIFTRLLSHIEKSRAHA